MSNDPAADDCFEWNGKRYHAQEWQAAMGMDALRLALGQSPRNFTAREIVAWLNAMDEVLHAQG